MAKCAAYIKYPKEYKAWTAMKYRCSGTEERYVKYVENNITVCAEWIKNFYQFYADVGPAPTIMHSLDRIDNLKGYSKDNVRWATATQQANNRSLFDVSVKPRDVTGKFI